MLSKQVDQLVNWITPLARKDGVLFEFYATNDQATTITFQKDKLKNHSLVTAQNLNLRVSQGEKCGVSYTKGWSKSDIEDCYRQARHSLALSDAKEAGELSSAGLYKDFSAFYNPDLAHVRLSEKIKKAQNMNLAVLSFDSRVQPVYSLVIDVEMNVLFGNSNNNQGYYKNNFVHAISDCLAIGDKNRGKGMAQQFGRSYEDIDFQEVGEESASQSIKKLSNTVPKTGTYPVVFYHKLVSPTFLSLLLGHINGKAVYNKMSLLSNKWKEKIFSDNFYLYDDPITSWGRYGAIFDGEGFPAQKTTLVEGGVLQNYLTSSFFAKALKVPHTAKAYWNDKGGLSISPTNVIMREGNSSFTDLLKIFPQVVILDSLEGLAGYNAVSGDFSLEAEGFLVDRNQGVEEQAHIPLCQFTVSGNIMDVFSNISHIANDSYLCSDDGHFSVKAPSFLVPGLSIAGK